MPRNNANPKTVLMATRVTPRIKRLVMQLAQREGLAVSEWLRNIVVMELKRNSALPAIIQMPEYELDVRAER
jgi:hypothetical protein